MIRFLMNRWSCSMTLFKETDLLQSFNLRLKSHPISGQDQGRGQSFDGPRPFQVLAGNGLAP